MIVLDPVVITRDELVHALTAAITDHRGTTPAARLKMGLQWDPQPAAAEAEACAELIIQHVQTLRTAGPR